MSDFIPNSRPSLSYDDFDDLDDIHLSQLMTKIESGPDNLTETVLEDLTPADFGVFDNFLLSAIKDDPVDQEKSVKSRFPDPVGSQDIQKLVDEKENQNTKKATDWVVRTWREWTVHRGDVPQIESMSVDGLNYFLSCFVIECRKKDGSEYTPDSIYQMCAGLLRYLRNCGVSDKNFLDVSDHRFDGFRKTLDARMKDLTSRGIGTKRKQADPIDTQDEDTLWETGQLGKGTSQSMTNTVFYYNCKLFGLRGMDEHRNLTCDQFVCGSDNAGTFIQFDGRTSKNYQGGLKHRKFEPKSIKHYSKSGEGRSLFDIYQLYLDKVCTGPFYRRPLDGNQLRFSQQLIGVNKLSVLVKNMCSAAGLQGQFTNHSGKRTCATTLFQNGIDEQLIMSRTGHRSTAVRTYKRPCAAQSLEVSKLLDPPKEKIVKVEGGVCKSGTSISDSKPNVNISTEKDKVPLADFSNMPKNVFHNCHVVFQ